MNPDKHSILIVKDETSTEDYTLNVKSETNVVAVKTEIESADDEDSEMKIEIELYVDHEIKEEMVIGPVVLQRDACNNSTTRSEDAPLLKKSKLETEDDKTDQVTQEEIKGNYSEEIPSNVGLNKNTPKDIKTREVKDKGPTENCNQRKHKQTTKMSKNVNILICNDCGEHFGEKCTLAAHIESHKKINKDNSNLTRQSRVYTGEKPYSCSFCDYKCTQKTHLTNHLRIHTGEKPFSCSLCKYKCARKTYLIRHLQIHTGEKPYSCYICKYKCTQKITLTRHLRIHSGDKPYSCSLCEYKCTQKNNLTKHLLIHTGEKPYSCSLCKYKCTQKFHLTKHLRIHTGEKPYSCSFCDFKCVLKTGLTKHQRIHNGEKPYSCSFCEYKCVLKATITKHQRIHTG